jgi:hypothetical protein
MVRGMGRRCNVLALESASIAYPSGLMAKLLAGNSLLMKSAQACNINLPVTRRMPPGGEYRARRRRIID